MKLIYIAGPYRAKTRFIVDHNIARARAWGGVVLRAGGVLVDGVYPVIPHSNTAHLDGAAPDAVLLAGSLKLLSHCDGVLLIPGWSESDGSRNEKRQAEALGKPMLDIEQTSSCGGLDSADDMDGAESLIRDWIARQVAYPQKRGVA